MADDQDGGEIDFDGSDPQRNPDGLTQRSPEAPVSDSQQEQAPTTVEAPVTQEVRPRPHQKQTPQKPTPPPAQPRNREIQSSFVPHTPKSPDRVKEVVPKALINEGTREIVVSQSTEKSKGAHDLQETRNQLIAGS